ncbi:MAG: hypothetical protein ISS47_05890 [Candidatus Omnitrophica bacterium]|nr:hypothetical protein [Candidatus Omnitrophota bacterium]
MNIYIYFLIVIVGILTIYTDIVEKKIKNLHLLVISSLAIAVYFIFFVLRELSMSFSFFLNPLAALIIGFLLYISGLWKAGDAKLFIVYALLLPTNKYHSILPLSCFVLFLNTFLISFLLILPLLLADIIKKKSIIIKEIISAKTLIYFSQIFLITFGLSWIIMPLLNFVPIKNNIFLNFILLYIGYSAIYKFLYKIKHKLLIVCIFLLGFVLRLSIMPDSFSFVNVINYLKFILKYSSILYVVRTIIQLDETKLRRIPLAPFMFIGAVLSNTGFLWGVIRILNYLRQ